MFKTIRKVAIIGGGPKGIYGFERLAAWLKFLPPSERTEIHIYNRTESFGAGENYRLAQPSWLMMNNPVGEINMWGQGNPPPVVSKPHSFQEWLCGYEGMKLSHNDYTSRAMAGRYLSHGFDLISTHLPENVSGRYIAGEVIDVYNDSGKYGLNLKTEGDKNHHPADRYDHVLLATGHPGHRESEESLRFQRFAARHKKAGYIPMVYPAETVFYDVPPDCSIGMKGLGLTFVDAVLALTEGKGGRFIRDESTVKLLYIPSGLEPKVIYPFSRSGLPMIPRRSVPLENNELRFFTRSAFEKRDPDKKADFKQQIWPILRQDMIYAYYDVALKNAGFPEALSGCKDFKDVERFVADYHKKYPSVIGFDADRFLDPSQESGFHRGKSQHQYIEALYNDDLLAARKGELRSPLAAVSAVWRKATSLFCEIYSFGGLTPESQRHFDHTIRPKLNRVTFGPPVKSAKKLYALMEAGILNFNAAKNPELLLDKQKGLFMLTSKPDGGRYVFQYLVDARIPKGSLDDDPGPLFRNLLNRGMITLYKNSLGDEVYKPGAINITPQGYVINKDGAVNRRLAATGTPTEGITFDNDTLSRDRNNFVDRWAESIGREFAKSTSEQYAS